MAIRWTTAFWDYPADEFESGISFWLKVTDSTMSERRGPDGEFATLMPAAGDAYLRVQRIREGKGGNHLDLHVDDVEAEAERAEGLGASVVHREPGLVVLRSPGGFAFCLVRHHCEAVVPPAVEWPGGQRSRADQVCLDVPPQAFDHELAFWQTLTAWRQTVTDTREFRRLLPPPELPLQFLLQRLDLAERGQTATAHMDLACSDIEAETERHVGLGAEAVRRHHQWQVMRDPGGLEYCITGRDPEVDLHPIT
ncbi:MULTISPECIES: VOC family protein [Glycomyces]|uniref:Enzyme related to lactoylglutathione lyase n=2 Tax=Glycomyces TaxID=58113 RepID=A0A9X3SVD2_9ACTN|nr:VOC family protein [Glycomyces lechevalierae]MDA1384647.1 VOC family protein [Glycomyces lechevalierae]MDR7337900.1 putative enzyme related to lactoylglutathione lyase [Glycomyces lechevalierae]